MRRFIALLLGYKYYVDATDRQTIVQTVDGYRYHNPQEFFTAAGVTSFQEAKDKKLIYKQQ